MTNDFDSMTDEERDNLIEQAKSAIQAVSVVGNTIKCPACGAPTRRDENARYWTIECACGWSAAGKSKATIN